MPCVFLVSRSTLATGSAWRARNATCAPRALNSRTKASPRPEVPPVRAIRSWLKRPSWDLTFEPVPVCDAPVFIFCASDFINEYLYLLWYLDALTFERFQFIK